MSLWSSVGRTKITQKRRAESSDILKKFIILKWKQKLKSFWQKFNIMKQKQHLRDFPGPSCSHRHIFHLAPVFLDVKFFSDLSLVMKTRYVSHLCINIYFWKFVTSLILVYYKFGNRLGDSSQVWWSIYVSVDQNQGLQFHCNEASQNNRGKNPHVALPSSSPYSGD